MVNILENVTNLEHYEFQRTFISSISNNPTYHIQIPRTLASMLPRRLKTPFFTRTVCAKSIPSLQYKYVGSAKVKSEPEPLQSLICA